MRKEVALLAGVVGFLVASACQDPPQAGQLVIDVDRLALRPGVSQISFDAMDMRLFYGQQPVVDSNGGVDCTMGASAGFAAQTVSLDLSQTGRSYLATVNAPPGMLQEIWLVIDGATVTESGISRPLHPSLHCTHGAGDVVRLISTVSGGVQVSTSEVTEIAAQFDPNTDLDHKDPDQAGGNGNGKPNPDANGDVHGGWWGLTDSLPFVLVPPESGTGIVDGEIVVRFKDGTSATDIQSAIAAQSMSVSRAWQPKNYYVLTTPNGADERPILEYYAGLGSVAYVSPNTYVGPSGGTFDPRFPEQVQWPQVGLSEVCITGTPPTCDGAASTTSGWQKTVGTFKPLVAIVDVDFDMTNPDIIPNLFINTDEVPQEVLNHVGDRNGDLVVDWHDLDADGDGVLTFPDLDAMNLYCAETHIVNQQLTPNCGSFNYRVCSSTPCTPGALVTGAGRPDPNRTTCATQPQPLNGTWEDGVDGNGTSAGCNGFVDDVVGWNFNCIDPKSKALINVDGVTGCNLQEAFASSTTGPFFLTHGTTVASIVGASGANGIDGAGVAWRARLLPIQLLLSNQSESNGPNANIRALRDSVFMGTEYARTMHPNVLNLSLGSYAVIDNQFNNANALGPAGCPGGPTVVFPASKTQLFGDFQTMLTSEMHELQQDTLLDGTLAVVASGDCALDHDQTSLMVDYPGSMRGSNVLTVGSVGAAGKPNADGLSAFSDFGSENVDIAAPGEFFVVATIGTSGTYTGATNTFPVCEMGVPVANDTGCAGTSFSAPMVSGAAALLLAADASLTGKPCSVADRILRNADALGGLTPSIASGRRLNVANVILDANSNSVRSCP